MNVVLLVDIWAAVANPMALFIVQKNSVAL